MGVDTSEPIRWLSRWRYWNEFIPSFIEYGFFFITQYSEKFILDPLSCLAILIDNITQNSCVTTKRYISVPS